MNNKKLRVAAMSISMLLITAMAFGETISSEKDLKPFTDKLMDLIIKDDTKKAFALMKPYVVIPESELQAAADKTQTQREQFSERYGIPTGYEFMGEKKAGESLIRLVYLEKMEKHALIWVFYFYKTEKGWILNSFSWDDQMQIIFQ